MAFETTNNGSSESGSQFSRDDFGLEASAPTARPGEAATGEYRSPDDWWKEHDDLRRRLRITSEKEKTLSERERTLESDAEMLQALREAKSSRDVRKLLQLAGIDPSDLLGELPALITNDPAKDQVAELKSEIERLKGQLSETAGKVTSREEQEAKAKAEARINEGKAKIREMINRDEFKFINRMGMHDTVWDAAKEFTERNGRPPSQQEIIRIAGAIENAFREQARPIRDEQLPLEPLDLEGLMGGTVNPPPASPVTLKRGPSPTLTNASTARAATSDAPGMTREQRRERALQAARRVRGL